MQYLRGQTVNHLNNIHEAQGILYILYSNCPPGVKTECFPDFRKEDIFMPENNKETNERIRRAEIYSTKCRLRELRKERRRSKMVLTASKIIIILAAVLLGAVIGGGLY